MIKRHLPNGLIALDDAGLTLADLDRVSRPPNWTERKLYFKTDGIPQPGDCSWTFKREQ